VCANWRGSKLTLTAQTLIWCLSMGKQHMLSNITTHFIFSLDFFCNHICLLQQLHTTRKYAIWWSGLSAVKILWWKVGSTPRKIRHVRRKLLCSSLGAVKNLEQGLHLGAFNPHLKTPFFGSVSPLWKYTAMYKVHTSVSFMLLYHINRYENMGFRLLELRWNWGVGVVKDPLCKPLRGPLMALTHHKF